MQVESFNMFLKDIKSHGSALVVKRYLGDVDEAKMDLVVQLTEANEADCCFGLALG